MLIRVPGTLLRFTDYQKELRIEAPTLKDGIDKAVAQFPELGKQLYDQGGQVRATHRLFVNGEAVEKNQIAQPVNGDDVVDILTAITGG